MRVVVALGGNALLERDDRPDAEVQQHHVRTAAAAIAPLLHDNEVIICHGNGPQIGLLAVESADDARLSHPYPLDVLGAQTQGMIGYWLAQELANAGVTRPVAMLLTQTIVDEDDPAFATPTKFIGRGYGEDVARRIADQRGWSIAADGASWRRVVASPEPRALVEMETVVRLLALGVVVVCAGGGGVPVIDTDEGLRGVEAVVDKDLTAALVAIEARADRLVMLTDVDGVKRDFGTPDETSLVRVSTADLRGMRFPAGSMGPKIEAGIRFCESTGHHAVIGALGEATAVLAGTSGTTIVA